jgi:hypothetical protein
LLLAALLLSGLFLAAAAVPIAWVETQCGPQSHEPSPAAIAPASGSGARFEPLITEPPYRQPLAGSYLSYPGWYVVHAHEDLAGVLETQDEYGFSYLAAITGYWSSLCGLRRFAASLGDSPDDWRMTLYLTGVGFSLEMVARGAYEETIGRLTAWWRGSEKLPEDRFALALAKDHARFLQQQRWQEYPFFGMLKRLWVETPWAGDGWVRRIERRFALSAGLMTKGVFATGVGWFAGASPADRRIRSVVRGLHAADREVDARIVTIRSLGDGRTVIETPRHRAFTEIVRALLARGRALTEIAGNERVLITVLLPDGRFADSPAAVQLFAYPLQARPGWRRVGLDANIPALGFTVSSIAAAGGEFEHLYDH